MASDPGAGHPRPDGQVEEERQLLVAGRLLAWLAGS